MKHALLIAGHGSRDPDGIAEFLSLARHFRERRPEQQVEIAFLEFARPTIQEGFDRLVQRGAKRIVMLPGVLMAAGHAKNDMASEVRLARERYPHVEILMGRALEVEPKLLELCRLRYREAIEDAPEIDPRETLLLLVGRGSSDPDANGNIAKVARFLQEGYPAGWSAHCFSGVARPLLEEALPVCERMGFRRIVVQPYFLFTGILLKRIYAYVEERRLARPAVDIRAAPHLQAHPLLLETFEERAHEAVHGEGHMNCSLCRYRVPIIGHEHALGEPQQPHHHHVQGLHEHVHELSPAGHRHDRHYHETEPEWRESEEPHIWEEGLVTRLRF
jgi:sirohydrochlorin cobaltochelatase